jgi:sec-independent protein translocase protein TatA
MDFLGMGAGEILVIIVVALIIWGPGRIINISRALGKMVHDLRKAAFDLTTQISKETEEPENKRPPQ